MTTLKQEEILALFPIIVGDVKLFHNFPLWIGSISRNIQEFDNFVKDYYPYSLLYRVGTLKYNSFVTSSLHNVYAFTNEENALLFKMKFS